MKKNYSNYTLILFLVYSLVVCNSAFAQLPPIISPIQGPSNVCSQPSQSSYTVSATNSPTSYNWSFSGPSGIIINNPSGAVTTINFPYPNLNTTYTLYCSAANNGGTSTTTSLIVHVYETPRVTFSGATGFCQGSSTNLSASPTIYSSSSTLSYNWSPSTGLNTTSGPNVTVSPPSTTNYTVLLTLGNSIGSCTNTTQLTIAVYPCFDGLNSVTAPGTEFLSVYPNPGSDSFALLSSKDELAVILNEIGQTVRSFNLLAGSETRITGLPVGIYFIVTPTSRKKIVVTN